MTFRFREFTAHDSAAVLRLNAESVEVLNAMDQARLDWLNQLAAWHLIAEDDLGVQGFLLTFTDGSAYDSTNYRWLAARFKQFLYVDRIVIDAGTRGRGLGRKFYQQAEAYAKAHGLLWLLCEVDVVPPNPVSLAFHRRLGFVEVGQQVSADGKTVAFFAKALS